MIRLPVVAVIMFVAVMQFACIRNDIPEQKRLLGKDMVCEGHGVPLRSDVVPIQYGLSYHPFPDVRKTISQLEFEGLRGLYT